MKPQPHMRERRQVLSVRVDPEVSDALRAEAEAEGVTVSHLVARILRRRHTRKAV
jgi:predicted HicB family RNase H-like nuclease